MRPATHRKTATTTRSAIPPSPSGFTSAHPSPEAGHVHVNTFCAADACETPEHWRPVAPVKSSR